MNPRYPIYIPSKGRWESRHTSKALEKINVSYYIVIEQEEYDNYAAVIDSKKILVLPFSDKGLVSTRNWIKEHSISIGAKRHWQIDDNITRFCRLNKNLVVPVSSGTIFRAAEDFTDRYENIVISGFQYFMFVPRKQYRPPYYLNNRVYSCSLIHNEFSYKWRDTYNDDTDICLRILKDKLCTLLFNAFICDKLPTMTVKGGLNTEKYYQGEEGRLKMAESLVRQHPDVTTIVWKWGRWQHHVDYSRFRKNKLIRVSNYNEIVQPGVNNYGMVLKTIK